MSSRRVKELLLLGVVVLLVNSPAVSSAWNRWRIERSGVDVAATVTDSRVMGRGGDAAYYVEFTLPRDVDPARQERFAQVDAAAYERARAAGSLGVRVLEDEPASFRAEGQVRSRAGLVLTLVADLLLLGVALLLGRGRGRMRPQLRMLALSDVEPGPPDPVLDRVAGDRYVVCGLISAVDEEEDAIELDVDGRSVRVLLGEHRNPVGHREPARVTGRMIG